MKKNNFYLFAIFNYSFLPKIVLADDKQDISNIIERPNGNFQDKADLVKQILGDVLGFARWAGLAICVIMLVWCAMKLATSAGNTQKRALAMDGIKNVLIAVAIIGSATLIATVAYGILNR